MHIKQPFYLANNLRFHKGILIEPDYPYAYIFLYILFFSIKLRSVWEKSVDKNIILPQLIVFFCLPRIRIIQMRLFGRPRGDSSAEGSVFLKIFDTVFPLNEHSLEQVAERSDLLEIVNGCAGRNGCGQTRDWPEFGRDVCCKYVMKGRKREQFRYAIF
jgi:hypothetical protein